MVYGIDTFRERFRAFTDNYVIIGGAACDQMLSRTAISPRATEDIDMIVVEKNVLGEPSGFHIEPIPAGEYLSSLSAIIMDDDYYRLTLDHSTLDDGLRVADFKALVCLKAKAYLNLMADREAGIHRNTKDIKKHRSDVMKLTAGDPDPRAIVVGERIARDIQEFVTEVDVPEIRQALKASINVDDALLEGYLDILRSNYLPR